MTQLKGKQLWFYRQAKRGPSGFKGGRIADVKADKFGSITSIGVKLFNTTTAKWDKHLTVYAHEWRHGGVVYRRELRDPQTLYAD